MPDTRRKLTVVLAAGALTMFGAASAFGGGGGAPSARPTGDGGENPVCAGPLAATPFCSGNRPPGEGGGGGGGSHPH